MPACVARTVTVPGVPASVSVVPVIVAGPETTLKVTGKPELATALSVCGAAVAERSASAAKVIVWVCWAAETVRSAVAALRLASPAWIARTTTAPVSLSVSVALASVALPLSILYVTGRPVLAVALRV